MKKKILSFLMIFTLAFLMIESASAATSRVVDMADLISSSDEAYLASKLDEMSQRLDFDVVVVTSDDLGGSYPEAYADDYFDYNGYGLGSDRDGALLLISMEPGNRYVHISTRGYGIKALTDSRIDDILDDVVYYLQNEDYAGAMEKYADDVDHYVTDEKTPTPLGALISRWIVSGGVIGTIVGAIRTGVMKGKMKSVFRQSAANNYIVDDVNITRANEFYLYSTFTQTARPKESSSSGSSTHTSSSGASHGGGGRSF